LLLSVHIDAVLPGTNRLVPTDLVQLENVQRQLNAVDLTPHPGLLYGFHPEDDRRPQPIKQAMSSVYEEKIEALTALIKANEADAYLVAAYQAKIAKEAGGREVRHDPGFQKDLRGFTRDILLKLDDDLRQKEFTLALRSPLDAGRPLLGGQSGSFEVSGISKAMERLAADRCIP